MRLLVLLALLLLPMRVAAQQRVHDLATLQQAAMAHDPRARNPEVLAEASRLRLENLRAQRLPQLAVTGQATYQSDAATIPISLPGLDVPGAPLERFQAQAEATQLLYDGGRLARQADLERAMLAEQQSGVAVSLYALRQAVTESYFGALLAAAQADVLALQDADLAAQLALLKSRVEHGAALPADTATLAAERIRVEQAMDEAEAHRRTALTVLARFTGMPVAPEDSLALPEVPTRFAGTLPEIDRPELDRFERTRERLETEARLAAAQRRPQVSLFGQAGAARPSPFEPFSDEFKPFALLGVRLRWAPLNWGQTTRDAEIRRLQAQTAAHDADAFRNQIVRDVENEIADLDRLKNALASDDRAVALREEVVRVARRQLEEGVLLPVQYTDRLNDLTDARLTRERHRIERARAYARLHVTAGMPPETL